MPTDDDDDDDDDNFVGLCTLLLITQPQRLPQQSVPVVADERRLLHELTSLMKLLGTGPMLSVSDA